MHLSKVGMCLLALLCCQFSSGCVFMREASDFGVHALCRATGQPSACLSTGDIVSLEAKTGYLDVTRAFPNTVQGIGSIVMASDAFGLRYVGNALECLPDSARPPLAIEAIAPPERRRNWSEVDDYTIYPGAFVQLERIARLGPKFDEISSVRVEIRTVERVSVDIDALQAAIERSYPIMSVACRESLLRGGYLVVDALRASHIAYALKGKNGRTLSTTDETLPQYLTTESSDQFEFEGRRLLATEPKYFAIGGVVPLGSSDESESDLVEIVARHCKYVRSCYNY